MKVKVPEFPKSKSRKVNNYVGLRLLLNTLRRHAALAQDALRMVEATLTGGQLAEARGILNEIVPFVERD